MTTQIIFERLKILFPRYKWFFILGFLLFLVLVMILSFGTQQQGTQQQTIPTPTTAVSASLAPSPTPFVSDVHGGDELYESDPTLQKKETLTDGSIKYTFLSTNPSRPNIIIVQGQYKDTIYERSQVIDGEPPVLLTEYLTFFGQPTKIMKGSRIYGADAQTYFYAERGWAYIANPKTDRVLEIQDFPSMDISEYLTKYGEDIVEK